VKDEIPGAWGASTVNAGELAEPWDVVTWKVPVAAFAGTTASTSEALTTVYEKAGCPLNETAETPRRFVPARTTVVPGLPWVGVTALIAGAWEGGGGADELPPPPQAMNRTRVAKARARIGAGSMVAPDYGPHESRW